MIWSNLKSTSKRIVYDSYIFINSNLLSYKNQKLLNISQTGSLGKSTIFAKNADFLQKNRKIKGFLLLKGIFSVTTYLFVLTYQMLNF